jgi:hypothetical protein
MRYALMLLGAIGLAVGILASGNATHAKTISQAQVLVQLGGVFLAIGMVAVDIVEAIKRRPQP